MEEAFKNLRISSDFSNYRSGKRRDGKDTDRGRADSSMEEDDSSPDLLERERNEALHNLQNSLTGMSSSEISQHHEMCMRLAAENKINLKNAFALHLITIMKRMVKDSPDLQLASLSLAASSKIYSGRVEALYKETFKFHSNLKSMVAGGKKTDNQNEDLGGEEVSDKGEKSSEPKSKCKSYLTAEDNLSNLGKGESLTTMQPHGNYVLINSAFSNASRSAEKLLKLSLQHEDNKICLKTYNCLKSRKSAEYMDYPLPSKCKTFLEKLNALNLHLSELEDLDVSPVRDAGPLFSPNQDFEAAIGCNESLAINNISPIRESDSEMAAIIDRFSVLDITADEFAGDISHAVTSVNTVDEHKLPPNSVLKKVLKGGVDTRLKHAVKKKLKVPFFNTNVVDKSLFIQEKKHCLTDVAISEWGLPGTSVFTSDMRFGDVLQGGSSLSDPNVEKEKPITEDELVKFTHGTNLEFIPVKEYFFKRTRLWSKRHERYSFKLKLRPSSLVLRKNINTQEFREEDLVECFRRLSFSFQEASKDDGVEGDRPTSPISDGCEDLDFPNTQNVSSHIHSLYMEQNLDHSGLEKDELVAPPELVKPVVVKYDKSPTTFNTEKIKESLWSIICEHCMKEENNSVLLTVAHKELEKSLQTPEITESLSLQFTFVILLILANEKVLLLENVVDSNDIIITKDVSEIDSNEVF